MQTEIIRVGDARRDAPAIARAAQILKVGGLVAFPTETVYGLGADALNQQAVAGIFAAKGRPQDNPLIVHVASIPAAELLVRELPENARKLMNTFWPGPLSIILPKSNRIPAIVSGGLDSVALRIPAHPVALALLRQANIPVAAPSANRSGRPSCTSAAHCQEDLNGLVDAIVDGGSSTVGLESTVLAMTGAVPRILRPGAISAEQIAAVIGVPVELDPAIEREMGEDFTPLSPGMKYRHYAPKAEVTLLHGTLEQFVRYLSQTAVPDTWAMIFEEDAPYVPIPHVVYGSASNAAGQGQRLFAALRELDAKQAKQVFVRTPPRDGNGVGYAVYNRLLRAAAFREIHL